LDENFSDAYYHRGISKLNSRRHYDAIEDFRKAMELDTSSKNPGIYDGLGCCYQAIEDYD
jgi:tetratricopeptide (TPR) repeat protein